MFWPGAGVDAGFVILLLWLFTQLYPAGVAVRQTGTLRFLFQDLHNLALRPTVLSVDRGRCHRAEPGRYCFAHVLASHASGRT